MTQTIDDGGLARKDPADIRVVTIDWDDHLGASVTISSFTAVATAIRPSSATVPTLTTTGSGLGIQAGSRSLKIKIEGGTLGALYEVNVAVTTGETPAQTFNKMFRLLVENL